MTKAVLGLLTLAFININSLYSDTESWKTEYKEFCAGRKQSPIDINDKNTVYDDSLENISLRTNEKLPDTYEIENDGKTIEVKIDDKDLFTLGFNKNVYDLASYEMHWAANENFLGSEHTVNGIKYAVEVQFKFHNNKEDDINDALDKENGVVIMSMLFKEGGSSKDSIFSKIMPKDFSSVYEVGGKAKMNAFDVREAIISTKNIDNFVTYDGSLTKPYCNQEVKWILFTKPNYISTEQLKKLRQVKFADGDIWNFRDIQPRNSRVITKNFEGTVSKSSKIDNFNIILGSIVFLVVSKLLS